MGNLIPFSIGRRSALHFAVLAIFMIIMTLVILDKAADAVSEIQELEQRPIYLMNKNVQ